MKKLYKFLCVIMTIFISFNLVSCKNTNDDNNDVSNNVVPEEQIETPVIECNHNYEFTNISIAEDSEVSRPGIYTCSKCNHQKTQSLTYEDIGLPTIDFKGSLDGISKENELKISLSYNSEELKFDCDAKIKVQGASSSLLPKKNYTIKLYKSGTNFDKKHKVELVDGWGEENKYCLKANYIDYSQARNVVSGKLYGQIVKSRNNGDNLEELYNGGAIDGYPVVIFLNGSFLGLYTMNIPKDKWLFDMDDYDPEDDAEIRKEAILMADGWTESTALREPINPNYVSSQWELEFCSTEEYEEVGTDWVAESFNEFIAFLNNNNGYELKEHLDEYIDVERAIDCFIYTNMIFAGDNTAKNMLWVTYDGGDTWIPSMYDMDGTWGLFCGGTLYETDYIKKTILSNNELYNKLQLFYAEEIKERYIELRSSVLSYSNIEEEFKTFFDLIPDFVREAEKSKWPDVHSQETNNFDHILNFTGLRLSLLDEYFIFKQ